MRFGSVLLPLAGLALASCTALRAPAPEPTGPALSGKIDYRELELLPRGSTLEVRLLRTLDGEEQLVGTWSQLDPGQAPFDFELAYDPQQVQEPETYALSASIIHAERPLFRSTERFEIELWEEAQRIALAEEARRVALAEEARRQAALAAGADRAGEGALATQGDPATPEPTGAAGITPEPRPVLDIGRIVLTKVPRIAATAALPDVAYVRGRAETRLFERLPEGARLHVQLVPPPEGAPLAEWDQAFPGDTALEFELSYDPELVEPGQDYRLRAEVLLAGVTIYRTTDQPPVDLDAALARMRAVSLAESPFPDELIVPNLQLVRIPGAAIAPAEPAPLGEPVVRGSIHSGGQDVAPPGARLALTLVGTSELDRSEEILAQSSDNETGAFPIVFELPYDPARVDPQREYSLRAEITHEGESLFKTTTRFPVDLSGVEQGALLVEAGTVVLTQVPRRLEPVPDLDVEAPPGPADGPVRGQVHGRIVYLGRRPLPADAVLEVSLIATSPTLRTDEVLAQARDESPGQVPIDFSLEYDPGQVDPANEHTVRAVITSGGQKLYLTTRKAAVELPRAPESAPEAWLPPPANAGNVLVTEVPR